MLSFHAKVFAIIGDVSAFNPLGWGAAVNSFVSTSSTFDTAKVLFDKNFKTGSETARIVRTAFFFGNPLDIDGTRYKNAQDKRQEQEDKFFEFS